MKAKQRILTARYFPASRLSRIYIDGVWTYTTDDKLFGCTQNDIEYFLRNGNYWKK